MANFLPIEPQINLKQMNEKTKNYRRIYNEVELLNYLKAFCKPAKLTTSLFRSPRLEKEIHSFCDQIKIENQTSDTLHLNEKEQFHIINAIKKGLLGKPIPEKAALLLTKISHTFSNENQKHFLKILFSKDDTKLFCYFPRTKETKKTTINEAILLNLLNNIESYCEDAKRNFLENIAHLSKESNIYFKKDTLDDEIKQKLFEYCETLIKENCIPEYLEEQLMIIKKTLSQPIINHLLSKFFNQKELSYNNRMLNNVINETENFNKDTQKKLQECLQSFGFDKGSLQDYVFKLLKDILENLEINDTSKNETLNKEEDISENNQTPTDQIDITWQDIFEKFKDIESTIESTNEQKTYFLSQLVVSKVSNTMRLDAIKRFLNLKILKKETNPSNQDHLNDFFQIIIDLIDDLKSKFPDKENLNNYKIIVKECLNKIKDIYDPIKNEDELIEKKNLLSNQFKQIATNILCQNQEFVKERLTVFLNSTDEIKRSSYNTNETLFESCMIRVCEDIKEYNFDKMQLLQNLSYFSEKTQYKMLNYLVDNTKSFTKEKITDFLNLKDEEKIEHFEKNKTLLTWCIIKICKEKLEYKIDTNQLLQNLNYFPEDTHKQLLTYFVGNESNTIRRFISSIDSNQFENELKHSNNETKKIQVLDFICDNLTFNFDFTSVKTMIANGKFGNNLILKQKLWYRLNEKQMCLNQETERVNTTEYNIFFTRNEPLNEIIKIFNQFNIFNLENNKNYKIIFQCKIEDAVDYGGPTQDFINICEEKLKENLQTSLALKNLFSILPDLPCASKYPDDTGNKLIHKLSKESSVLDECIDLISKKISENQNLHIFGLNLEIKDLIIEMNEIEMNERSNKEKIELKTKIKDALLKDTWSNFERTDWDIFDPTTIVFFAKLVAFTMITKNKKNEKKEFFLSSDLLQPFVSQIVHPAENSDMYNYWKTAKIDKEDMIGRSEFNYNEKISQEHKQILQDSLMIDENEFTEDDSYTTFYNRSTIETYDHSKELFKSLIQDLVYKDKYESKILPIGDLDISKTNFEIRIDNLELKNKISERFSNWLNEHKENSILLKRFYVFITGGYNTNTTIEIRMLEKNNKFIAHTCFDQLDIPGDKRIIEMYDSQENFNRVINNMILADDNFDTG